MQQRDPDARRRSINAHLNNYARNVGIRVEVVRRQVALERLIVRLMRVAPGRWALKGGLALETRIPDHARASEDMDIDHQHGSAAAREDLSRAVIEELGDGFTFAVAGRQDTESEPPLAEKYTIECAIFGAVWVTVRVDVTLAAPEDWEVEAARRPGLLEEFGPIEVPLVPIERQVAEKLHVYTRPYRGGSTRTRDLVDFVLIRSFQRPEAAKLARAISQTFTRRGTHSVPERFPAPPKDWRVPYRRDAEAVGITTDVVEAHALVAEWLDPVLQKTAEGTWDPEQRRWMMLP